MTAYRFCRTDDIALLVDALNRCWVPYVPDEPPVTPVTFKRAIRDLQVWCSSCMVAFSSADPIGVLIGAKRPSGTLVHTIAVHPEHRRQGHAHHLLASLGSKLAILGPPRIMAEVPETLAPACGLFRASGYLQEALLTDYVWQRGERDDRHGRSDRGAREDRGDREDRDSRFVIPVTVDDLAANGLLGDAEPQMPSQPQSPACWARSGETLAARKGDIAGLAVASAERIEAYLLYLKGGAGPPGDADGDAEAEPRAGVADADVEIVALRSFIEDDGAGLKQLLARLRGHGARSVTFPKVHPAEIPPTFLETLGFRPAGGHLLYAATARSG